MPEQETSASPSPKDTSRPIPWWVRWCRWLWRALLFFWTTIIVGLLVGIFSTVLFLAKGTDLHTLIVGEILDWVQRYLILSLVALLLLIMLTVLTWLVVRRFDVDHISPLL
jgi:ABC-type Fe3+ transport system permease subunit